MLTENEVLDSWKRTVKPKDDIEKEVYAIVENALEKQIAKTPISIDYEKYIDVVENAKFLRGTYWCPNCKHVVKSGAYCHDCGQKLDWNNIDSLND